MPEVRLDEPHRALLYIIGTGLLAPLGRSQVVPSLIELARGGVHSSVVSFETRVDLADECQRSPLQEELDDAGIAWVALPVHTHPRAVRAVWDVVRGTWLGWNAARKHRPQVVHARGYLAGVIGLLVSASIGSRFAFEMRGFRPEERVELGVFKQNGLLYRLSKLAERVLLGAADRIVSPTESAKAILQERQARAELRSRSPHDTPITVVPGCVDLDRFHPRARDYELARAHGLESSIVLGNIGAFNRRYMVAEMFRFAFHVRSHRPDARFVYLTRHDVAPIRKAAREAGLRDEDLVVLRAEPADVPRWLSLFRLGIFFLRPSYAAKGSSFTQLGEFLAAGVPVVTNTGVGDVDRILGANRCGFLLPGLTDRDLAAFARTTLPVLEGDSVPDEVQRNCRAAARQHFALEDGVRRYRAIYDSLTAGSSQTERVRVAPELG